MIDQNLTDDQPYVSGYTFEGETGTYRCLFCEAVFQAGYIYHHEDRLVDARMAAKLHIGQAHTSVFHAWLAQGKKVTGLTEVQSNLLRCFYEGMPDGEIARMTGTSVSTVRYQRFSFREKAKQAHVMTALSDLLENALQEEKEGRVQVHASAKMVDERYMTTEAEAEKIRKAHFSAMTPLKLINFPSKAKKQVVVLSTIADQFEQDWQYTEPEVNAVLKEIHADFATLRRRLIEYGFMDRTPDGGAYWRKRV